MAIDTCPVCGVECEIVRDIDRRTILIRGERVKAWEPWYKCSACHEEWTECADEGFFEGALRRYNEAHPGDEPATMHDVKMEG